MRAWKQVRGELAGSRQRALTSMRSAGDTQRRLLAEIIQGNRATVFGRSHRFSDIRDEQDFRQAVPFHTYEDFAPYIERMAAGEDAQLTSEAPIAFERTGGSISGPKLIPYTPRGLRAIQRAVHAWLEDLLMHRPGIEKGRVYWSISPATRQTELTASGLPIGLPSDAAYFGESLETPLSSLMAVAPEVGRIPSIEAWRAATLDALRGADDLTLISVWSPTFLLDLLENLPGDPTALWPLLDTISCWTSASAAPFARRLQSLFPGVQIQGKGLLATEGVITIPLCDQPYPALAVESGYYEFIDDAGTSCVCTEVITGAEYEVVLTTHSGLYRYRLGDRVRIRGWIGEAPALEFIGRGASCSDLCGEKLGEPFVNAQLESIEGFRLLAPAPNPPLRYILYLDAGEHGEDSARDLARRLDEGLRANPQYEYAARLGQLAPVDSVRVHRPLERYHRYLSGKGQRLGDIKAPGFSSASEWWRVFHEHETLSVRSGDRRR